MRGREGGKFKFLNSVQDGNAKIVVSLHQGNVTGAQTCSGAQSITATKEILVVLQLNSPREGGDRIAVGKSLDTEMTCSLPSS